MQQANIHAVPCWIYKTIFSYFSQHKHEHFYTCMSTCLYTITSTSLTREYFCLCANDPKTKVNVSAFFEHTFIPAKQEQSNIYLDLNSTQRLFDDQHLPATRKRKHFCVSSLHSTVSLQNIVHLFYFSFIVFMLHFHISDVGTIYNSLHKTYFIHATIETSKI